MVIVITSHEDCTQINTTVNTNTITRATVLRITVYRSFCIRLKWVSAKLEYD